MTPPFEWEVLRKTSENFGTWYKKTEITSRASVIDGWLYRTVTIIEANNGPPPSISEAMVFVPEK